MFPEEFVPKQDAGKATEISRLCECAEHRKRRSQSRRLSEGLPLGSKPYIRPLCRSRAPEPGLTESATSAREETVCRQLNGCPADHAGQRKADNQMEWACPRNSIRGRAPETADPVFFHNERTRRHHHQRVPDSTNFYPYTAWKQHRPPAASQPCGQACPSTFF